MNNRLSLKTGKKSQSAANLSKNNLFMMLNTGQGNLLFSKLMSGNELCLDNRLVTLNVPLKHIYENILSKIEVLFHHYYEKHFFRFFIWFKNMLIIWIMTKTKNAKFLLRHIDNAMWNLELLITNFLKFFLLITVGN